MQLRGISRWHAGQVDPINLDDGKVRERIRADELGGEDSAISHGDANVHRAVNDMVVGSTDLLLPSGHDFKVLSNQRNVCLVKMEHSADVLHRTLG